MIRAAPALLIAHYLATHRHDVKSLAAEAGLGVNDLLDPMRFVPLRVAALFFAAATRAVNDCKMPLKLAESSDTAKTGLFGNIAIVAPTVRTALECLAGYAPIFVTGVEAGYSEQRGTGRFAWQTPKDFDGPTKPLNLFAAASLVHRVRLAAGPNWAPLKVTFEHKAPVDNSYETRLFGPRVIYNADCTSLTFDAATLAKPMPSRNAELFAIFRHHADLLLRDLVDERDLESRLRNVIGQRLTGKPITLDKIAAELSVSPRSLQRQLEQRGSSFERVLDETRCKVAERMLRETDRPLMQIAHEVGYGSQSTFTRAVRRWFDVSPRAYRQKYRGALGVVANEHAHKVRAGHSYGDKK